jgi:hypothetical protein
MANQSINSTTQHFLDIHDIANNFLIMKDGATAVVLTVDALNFGLLAEEEQDGIIYAYARLLNSLNYSIQILIRSQTKDITNYLQLLIDQEEAATSKLQKEQIGRYREFVSQLIQDRNVLDKKFYVVVPANSLEMGLLPPQTVVPGVKQVDISTFDRSVILEKAKNILEPKRDHLIGQFSRIGLYARQLQTQEIIQLFYNSYNPESSEGQQLMDSNQYTTPLVKASVMNQPPSLFEQAAPPVNNISEPTPAITQPEPIPQPAITQPEPTQPEPISQPNATLVEPSVPLVQVTPPVPVNPTTIETSPPALPVDSADQAQTIPTNQDLTPIAEIQ